MALRLPSSSSSSFTSVFTYDVFLSFRGSDTRFGFTGNLYKTLRDRGIHVFFDDEELKGGDEITPSLVKAIKESRIAIPVFSKNYASSSFCLDELVTIIECVKAEGRLVLPVFYGVDPSHVRHQSKSYGKALAKHEERFQNNKEKYTYKYNMDRLEKWKMALIQAADLSGKHFIHGKEYEYQFIAKIVEEVSKKINHALLHVADYPIGIKSRVLQVKSLLDAGFDDGVHMVGIYGIGGMGKTTLARAIYNSIANQFEGLCFLDDVREKSIKHGLVYLQETLLHETIKEKDIRLGSINKGITIIKQRLHRNKVLLILDDVNELKQLQVMAGEPDWFGPGSRVIITTRDKHLLNCHGIKRTYEVRELNKEEALVLLRWNAFKNNRVDSSYEYILNRAVTYASGLPLALEVVGSNLFGKTIEQWKSTLDRYEKFPNIEIQKIFKVSFDALDKDEQSVFLDIACCFKGYGLVEVEDILRAHYGDCMKHHIGVLVEKSLIKISHDGFVTLHDLMEDMGKEIVRQESPEEPGKRSRLWFHEDIVHVLEDNTGTMQIEIICMDLPSFEVKEGVECLGDESLKTKNPICMDFPSFEEEKEVVVKWQGDEFLKMENLKTLIIKSGCFSICPKHLPNSLRVLEWPRYPSQELPSDFCPNKLSICKLMRSGLTSFQLPGSLKRFGNMRYLNLEECQSLTTIPDVSGLSNLEEFSFRDCKNLITIDDSVGFLDKLQFLNANGCERLRSFPSLKLTSLQRLELSFCDSLKRFPEILEKMENITNLHLTDTCIEEFPFSFQNLTRLCVLRLRGHAIRTLQKLFWVDARGCHLLPKQNDKLSCMVPSNVQLLQLQTCNLSDEFLQIGLMLFVNVTDLDLSGSNFTIIPECIKECQFLRRLTLDDCKHLREIRGIPPNLKHLSAFHCESLTFSCKSMLLNQELHEAGSTQFCLPRIARIPEWFEHKSRGHSISFWFRNKLPSMALFFVSESMHNKCRNFEFRSLRANLIINGCTYALQNPENGTGMYLRMRPDHTYVYDLQLQDGELKYKLDKALLENEWNHAEVTYKYWVMIPLLIESGIHIFKQKSNMKDIRFTDPYKKRKLDYDDDGDRRRPILKVYSSRNKGEEHGSAALVGPGSEEPAAAGSQVVGVWLREHGQTKRTNEDRERITERTGGNESGRKRKRGQQAESEGAL